MRREFPKRIRIAAWDRCHGFCEGKGCGLPLQPHRYHFDHDLADRLGGEPTLENCRVLCEACHSVKTTKRDVPAIAKAKRIYEKRHGLRPPSKRGFKTNRGCDWKRTMDGRTVRRD